MLDNFNKLPVPKTVNISDKAKKDINYYLNFTNEWICNLPGRFLPYINLFIAARLIFYELAVLGLQNYSLFQLVPLIILEMFVTYTVFEGYFTYTCFETWGFFRYMCQQIAITSILYMGIIGVDNF